MVSEKPATEASFAKQVCKLSFGTRRNMSPEVLPSLTSVIDGMFEDLPLKQG